jgi:peptidoglycan/LPS O-acetylase OafA/YrhL
MPYAHNLPAAHHGHDASRNIGLDVARLMAALMVLVPHCTIVFMAYLGGTPPVPVLMSAFFGVELFFVLSGFLIGRLLFQIAETDPSPRGWLIFMVRRWLRTLPLYYLWLLVLPLVLPVPADFSGKLLHYATMTQNLAWPMPKDEWFNASWSLTIEEWFYLLFSAALLGAVALTRSSRAIWLVIVAFMVVPAVARMLQPEPADFVNDMYHTALLRLDAIAYGVALARLQHQRSRLFRHPWLALAAGVALVASFWVQDVRGIWIPMPRMPFLLGQLFGTSVGLCLFLVGMQHVRIRVRPLLWLVGTGSQMSYGLYIMHLTIIAAVGYYAALHGHGTAFVIVTSLVLIVALPYLSYRFFETPIMALRPRQARPAAAAGEPRERVAARPLPHAGTP